MMKKLLATFALSLAIFTACPAVVGAVGLNDTFCKTTPNANNTTVCKDTDATKGTNPLLGPDGILTTLIKILAILVGIVSLIVIIVSGIRYVLSGGDSNSVSQAKSAIIYAIVGLIVSIIAQSIVALVISKV